MTKVVSSGSASVKTDQPSKQRSSRRAASAKTDPANAELVEAVLSETAPSEDEIRILAYDLYEKRQATGADGDATSDWIEAERQLLRDPGA